MSGTGFNYIREIMQMDLPEESTPKPLREYENEAKRNLYERRYLGIGYDAPSAIEKHENMVIATWNMRYVGVAVHPPVSQHVYIRHLDTIYTKQHLAKIGDMVKYKDDEYVWTGEQWNVCNPEFKLPEINKEEKKMLTSDMVHYVGQTCTAIVVGSTNRTIRMTDGYHRDVTIGDIVRYKNDLFMFVDHPNPQKLPHWIGLVTIVPDKPNTAYHKIPYGNLLIKKVHYSGDKTIVMWEDGTKTIVTKGENEDFDPEKGLVMAIAKKAFGNQGNYYNRIKKWLPEIIEPIWTDDGLVPSESESVTDDTTASPMLHNTAVKIGKKTKEISSLLCDMVTNGATNEEIERVVQYSMAVIDTIKNGETCTRINKEFNIKELKAKYQPE